MCIRDSDTTITFKPASNVSSTKYATLPSFTAVGTGNTVVSNEYSFAVTTASTDAGGFGLRSIFDDPDLAELGIVLTKFDFVNTLFYYQTTKTISENLAGDGVSSTKITLSDITDLATGTQVYYHKGTTVPASTVRITSIDTVSQTVTFDNAVAFENSETITFRAYGSKPIYLATGLVLELSTIQITNMGKVSKTMRNDASGTTLELNNTLGITGGNIVSISGAGVDNSSTNTVTSVTPDPTGGDGDGSVVMQVSQNVSQGTVIEFASTFTSLTFSGSIVVTSFPSSNKEINLDLDQLLITGSAS